MSCTLSNEVIHLYKDFYNFSIHFKTLLADKYGDIPSKWWTLSFDDFIRNFKIQWNLQDKDELLQLFKKYKLKANEMNKKIESVEFDINQKIYELYNLNKDDISNIEKFIE